MKKNNKKTHADSKSSKRAKKSGKSLSLDQEVVHYLDKNSKKVFSFKEISKQFGIKGDSSDTFYKLLLKLSLKGQIEQLDDKHFRSSRREVILEGTVDFVNPNFAYVVFDDLEDDVKIYVEDTLHALDGDRVKVNITGRTPDGKAKGEIIEILNRKTNLFVGTLSISPRFAFVVCSGKKMHYDIFIPQSPNLKAQNGDKVIARITHWNDNDRNPTGTIVKTLGKAGENNTEMHAIMFEFGLPSEFEADVEKDAAKISAKITKKEIAARRDFRSITTFTIDPITAKDFDDALSIRKTEKGNWEIGIHIADVTHYVKENSLLEEEAKKRATSVYLVDRTIPMLPEKLSNGLCSLNPNEDKLTFSAVFELDEKANIKSEWFGRTVIHSDRRFSYEEAQQRIEDQQGDFFEELTVLNNLAKKLKDKRFAAGAISFESVEYFFELDSEGRPLRMVPKIRKDAHKLVEEFMLLANRKVAEFVFSKKKNGEPYAMVYRIHDEPDPDKIGRFAAFAKNFGFQIDTEPTKLPRSLNKLADKIAGQPMQNVLENLAVRAMAKAIYTTDPKGHYGLAFKHYTHFTSPIRRYPDMMAHRLLQFCLDNHPNPPSRETLEILCKHSSDMEKRAAEAERASIKYKQVEFMSQYIGKSFAGSVSGLTDWGLYVEMEETRCEGMVRLSDLTDDSYVHDSEKSQIIGRRYKRVYTFGTKVRVKVKAANLEKRTLDLIIEELKE
jgi:ribonuclease R